MPIQRNNTTTDNSSRQQSQARQGSVAAATPQGNSTYNNNRRRVVAIGLLALITIIISIIVYSSYFGSAAISRKAAKEIEKTANKRYTENFDHLSKRDEIAANIVEDANSKNPPRYGHRRFVGRVLVQNFERGTRTLKKFVNEDIIPYISRFAENTKQPAQECVHYLTPEEKKDVDKFGAAVNPTEGFRGGCKLRMIVDEEVSENDKEVNHAYKTLFEAGYFPSTASENPKRFVEDGNKLLVIATTRFDVEGMNNDFLHGRSTQMFNYRPDAGGAF